MTKNIKPTQKSLRCMNLLIRLVKFQFNIEINVKNLKTKRRVC